MGQCGQYLALMRKHWIVKRRASFSTFMELCLPMICFLILVLIRELLPPKDVPASLNLDKGVEFTQTSRALALFNVLEHNGSKLAFYPPNESQDLQNFLIGIGFEQSSLITFNNAEELQRYANADEYGTDNNPQIHAAVEVNDLVGPNYSYALRFNSTVNDINQSTPTTSNNAYNFYDSHYKSDWEIYDKFGFTLMADLIDTYILTKEKVYTWPTALGGYDMMVYDDNIHQHYQPFPTINFREDDFTAKVGQSLGFILTLVFIWPLTRIISGLVEEKELKLKASMQLMGLGSVSLYLSWLTMYTIIFFIISFLLCLASFWSVYSNSFVVLVFLIYFLFGLAVFAVGYLISAFFDNAKAAATFGTVVHVLSFFLFFVTESDSNPTSSKLAACLIPTVCLAQIGSIISKLEGLGIGVTPSTVGENVGNFSVGYGLWMLLIDIALYTILGLYFNQVVPSHFGIHKPWYFLFLPSFWCGTPYSRDAAPCGCCFKSTNIERNLPPFDPTNSNETFTLIEDPLETDIPVIKIRNLRKTFPSKRRRGWCSHEEFEALKGASLDIYANQITMVLGPNGAGKSTMFNLLTGLSPPTDGDALVNGFSIKHDISAIYQQQGVCFQHNVLYPNLTTYEHMKLFAAVKEMSNDGLHDEIIRLLDIVGLGPRGDNKLNALTPTLSGGQKRKLSIAISLLNNPKVLFLDEISTGIDLCSARQIWKVLLSVREGRCIVMTTHDMSEAAEIGDRICILGSGDVLCAGSTLFLKNHYGVGYTLKMNKTANLDAEADHFDNHTSPSTIRDNNDYAQSNQQNSSRKQFFRSLSPQMPPLPRPSANTITTPLLASPRHNMLPRSSGDQLQLSPGIDHISRSYVPPSFDSQQTPPNDPVHLPHSPMSQSVLDQSTDTDKAVGVTTRSGSLINEYFTSRYPFAVLSNDTAGEIAYRLPFSSSPYFPEMLENLDADKDELGISTYGVGVTSLTEVFLRVISGHSREELLLQNQLGQINPSSAEIPPQTNSVDIIVDQHDGKNVVAQDDETDESTHFYSLDSDPSHSPIIQITSTNFNANPNGTPSTSTIPTTSTTSTTTTTTTTTTPVKTMANTASIPVTTKNTKTSGSFSPRNLQTKPSLAITTPIDQLSNIHNPDPTENTHQFVDDTWGTEKNMNISQLSQIHIFWRHFKTLFIKRWQVAKRDRKAMIWQLLYPGIVLLGGLFALKYAIVIEPPRREMSAALYPEGTQFIIGNPVTSNSVINDIHRALFETAPLYHNTLVDVTTNNNTLPGMQQWLFDEYSHRPFDQARFGGILITDADNIPTTDPMKEPRLHFSLHFNTTAPDSLPIYNNMLHNALLRMVNPKGSIQLINSPLPLTKRLLTLINSSTALILALALSFVPASYAAYIVYERQYQIKHLQMVTGVSNLAYWVSNLAWDICNFALPFTLIVIILFSFNIQPYTEASGAILLILSLWLFVIAACPFTYALSFLFESHTTAQNMTLLIFFLSSVIFLVLSLILYITESTRSASRILRYFFFLFPGYCVSDISLQILTRKQIYPDSKSAWEMGIGGWNLAFLAIDFVLYTGLIVLLEHWSSNNTLEWIKAGCTNINASNDAKFRDPDEDLDVATLRKDIQRGKHDDPSAYPIVMKGLRKVYATSKSFRPFMAVSNVFLSVRKGQTLGLLGPNGSGKTTLTRLLTSDLYPSVGSGDALMGGYSLLHKSQNIRHLIGYCPQFDALLPLLTGRQHLLLYASIKCVPKDKINGYVNFLLKRLCLLHIADEIASTYSGGNKRKLSLGLAIIGNPPILLLDEMSSGTDPSSRRVLWDLLSSTSANRAVVLISHSQEEIESLSTKIAIFASGRVRCYGTGLELKDRFGSGLQVELQCRDGKQQQVEDWFNKTFENGLVLIEKHRVTLKFAIPKEHYTIAGVFRAIEDAREPKPTFQSPDQHNLFKPTHNHSVVDLDDEKIDNYRSKSDNYDGGIDGNNGEAGGENSYSKVDDQGIGIESYSVSEASLDQIFIKIIQDDDKRRQRHGGQRT